MNTNISEQNTDTSAELSEHNARFEPTLSMINLGELYLKRTRNIYPETFSYNDSIIRTADFYSEYRRIYTWQRKFNDYLYVYGNPFPSYSLGFA